MLHYITIMFLVLWINLLITANSSGASASNTSNSFTSSAAPKTRTPVNVIISASSTSIRRNELCLFWLYDLSAAPGIKGFRVYNEAGNLICFTENLDSLHLDCNIKIVNTPMAFSMTTYDANGNESAKSPLIAANKSPIASIKADGINRTVQFSGSQSRDFDNGSITEYAWNFGDGNAPSSGINANHTFSAPGHYIVRLTVTDNQGAMSTAELPLDIIKK